MSGSQFSQMGGFFGPLLNPPDLGTALRVATSHGAIPWPADPGAVVPRTLTVSPGTRQSSSLACESSASFGLPANCAAAGLERLPLPLAVYVNWALNQAEAEIARLLAQLRPRIPGMWMGPAHINFPCGNLTLQIPMPAGEPFDPVPVLTYNSFASFCSIQFGGGFSDLFNPTVKKVSTTSCDIVTGSGQCLLYKEKDGDGFFAAPEATRNALRQQGDTWTEYQPDGLVLHYDEDGALDRTESPAGARWTIARDEDGFLVSIEGPNSRRTTYTYSGNHLSGITERCRASRKNGNTL